jgi:hypothetical protein
MPARLDPDEPRWFEPLHVRDSRGSRERMASQVAAGADVIVAPTWQTHRRALVPVGETRQARAWTGAAVRVAREAVELGLEQRAEVDGSAEAGEEPGARAERGVVPERDARALAAELRTQEPASVVPTAPALPRPAPLVAASLPALDALPEPGLGRLLPRSAASERDYREQAGLLADQEPDLLLVEGQATTTELRVAVEAAVGTGLPAWVAVALPGLGGEHADRVMDALGGIEVAAILFPGRPGAGLLDIAMPWGGLVGDGPGAEGWLEAGAALLGLLDGATPEALAVVRAIIDRRERAALDAAQRLEDAWRSHVRRAAAMAEGGAALWLHGTSEAAPPRDRLPPGFEWLVVSEEAARQVPDGRFQLVVDRGGDPAAVERDARWLAEGGILATAWTPGGSAGGELRVLRIDDQAGLRLALLRRQG